MKKTALLLLLLLITTNINSHSWKMGGIEERNLNSDKKYLTMMSVRLGQLFNNNKYDNLVQRRTDKIISIWWQNKKKFKNIINPKIAIALAHTESNMLQITNKYSGCIGIFQLEVATAIWTSKQYGIKYNKNTIAKDLIEDEDFNILVGLAVLDFQLGLWSGKTDLAILGYKCGATRTMKLLKADGVNTKYQDLFLKVYRFTKFLEGQKEFTDPKAYYDHNVVYGPKDLKYLKNYVKIPKIKIVQ